MAEAEKLFYAALQEAEKFAHLDLRLAKNLKSLGRVYENTGRQDDAKSLYKRFVEIMERADAKRDPEYVDHMMRWRRRLQIVYTLPVMLAAPLL